VNSKRVPVEYQDLDTELAKLVDAWPSLPGKVKAEILAMIEVER